MNFVCYNADKIEYFHEKFRPEINVLFFSGHLGEFLLQHFPSISHLGHYIYSG
jgi:hypothetical protein